MKIPKKLLWVLLAVALRCSAQDGTKTYTETLNPALEKKGSATPGIFTNPRYSIINTIASRYWGSIVGGIFYSGGSVNFTDFSLTVDDPLGTTYTFVGMINPLDTFRYDYNGGTEYYAAVGKTLDMWKGGAHDFPAVRLDLMVLYDAISQIDRLDDDVVQQYVKIELPRIPIAQPYVQGYHWFKTGDRAPEGGFFGRAGIHRQQPLGFSFRKTPIELGIDLSSGWSSEGLFGTSRGLAYHRAILSTVFTWNKHFKIIPAIIGQLPGRGQDENRKFVDHSRLFYNLTLRYDF